MTRNQMSAVRRPVRTQEELQHAYDNPRRYAHGRNKTWLVFVTVSKVKDEDRWEWAVHLRLWNGLKKRLKAPKDWNEGEWAQARKMGVSELNGVGRIASSGEVAGSDYLLVTRDLTPDETLLATGQSLLGH